MTFIALCAHRVDTHWYASLHQPRQAKGTNGGSPHCRRPSRSPGDHQRNPTTPETLNAAFSANHRTSARVLRTIRGSGAIQGHTHLFGIGNFGGKVAQPCGKWGDDGRRRATKERRRQAKRGRTRETSGEEGTSGYPPKCTDEANGHPARSDRQEGTIGIPGTNGYEIAVRTDTCRADAREAGDADDTGHGQAGSTHTTQGRGEGAGKHRTRHRQYDRHHTQDHNNGVSE